MSIQIDIKGPNLVKAALESPYTQISSIDTNEYFYNHLHLNKYKNQSIIKVINTQKSSKGREQVQARIHLSPFYSFDDSFIEKKTTLLFLDHLNDPQNVGNAIRHAVAFNIDAIILPQHKSCPINETVARASVGALFQVPLFYISGINPFLKRLKDSGFGLIGAALEKAESFKTEHFWPKTVIAIGNEGSGLRSSTIKLCDTLIKIEHSKAVQSLNAATTATLLCYERTKSLAYFHQ